MIISEDDNINSASDIQGIDSLVKLDPNPAIQSRTLTAEVPSSSVCSQIHPSQQARPGDELSKYHQQLSRCALLKNILGFINVSPKGVGGVDAILNF